MKFPKQQQQFSGPSKFLKLQDGEAQTVILRGEVHAFQKTWPDGKVSQRYSVNALVPEGTSITATVWEFGPMVYDKLAEINEVYALDTIKIRVKRTGTKLDTEYNIMPLLKPEDTLTASQLKVIEGVTLNILDKEPSPPMPKGETGSDNWNGF